MSSTLSGLRICPRRGFSLIEAAIVLGVIGLVIGGIWIGAEAVNRNLKMNNTVNGLISGVQDLRRLYKDVTATDLIAANGHGYVVAAVLESSPGYSTRPGLTFDPFGNGLDVQIRTTADGDAINVSYYDVSPDFCMQMVPRLSGQNMADELYFIIMPNSDFIAPPAVPTLAQCTGSGSWAIQYFFKK